jgi:hypothetical protein
LILTDKEMVTPDLQGTVAPTTRWTRSLRKTWCWSPQNQTRGPESKSEGPRAAWRKISRAPLAKGSKKGSDKIAGWSAEGKPFVSRMLGEIRKDEQDGIHKKWEDTYKKISKATTWWEWRAIWCRWKCAVCRSLM